MQMRCAIIGPGRVGSTLGARLLQAGWQVMYGSRHEKGPKLKRVLQSQPDARGGSVAAAVEWAAGGGGGGGAVLLAVPGGALASEAACAQFAAALGPHIRGQIVVDATNPLDAECSSLCWERGRSSAEALQAALPGSFCYKAFNTVGVEHMARPDGALVTGQQLALPFAGPPERRDEVAALISAVGFEPHWVGGLRYARNLEALAELYIALGGGLGGADWSAPDGTRPYHFQVLRGSS